MRVKDKRTPAKCARAESFKESSAAWRKSRPQGRVEKPPETGAEG